MHHQTNPLVDLGLAAFLGVLAIAVLFEAASLPPGVYEPLGSGPLPEGVAALILLFSLYLGGVASLALRRSVADHSLPTLRSPARGTSMAALLVVLVFCYLFAMQIRLAGFGLATSAFLLIAFGALGSRRPPALALALVLAGVTGFGGEWLFTHILIIDLPS